MKPSIFRVPERMKNMTRSQAYRPRLVSLGPFHHGEPDLLPMEEHKSRALLHLVKRAGKPLREFFEAVEEVADRLMQAYDGLDDKWRGNGDRFVQMMLTDGCFILEMMRTRKLVLKGKRLKDYSPKDPVFSIPGFYLLRSEIISDMILMENQLPLLVLKTIKAVQEEESDDNDEINKVVLHFLGRRPDEDTGLLGLHPLDLFHKSLCDVRRPRGISDEWEDTLPSAVELSEARIHFKRSNNTGSVGDINFDKGVLGMPLIIVDDEAEKAFLNLMAFERLYSRAGTDVTDYIIFMDNIINSERDVALLRSKGLIKSGLGNDKKIAELFNSLSKGVVMSPYCRLIDVQHKMLAHCRRPWNKWWAIFERNYLSNPWVFMSLVAAIILLVATVMQTIYTVVPSYKK